MTNYKCQQCGLVNNTIDGMECRRCGSLFDSNAQPFRSSYTPQNNQVQQYENNYQQNNTHKAITGAEAILWALCCFPVGYIRFDQGGKFLVWLLLAVVTGGIALPLMYVDYVMVFSVQQSRPLKPWEFFPRR